MHVPVVFHFFDKVGLLQLADSREVLLALNLDEKYHVVVLLGLELLLERFH